VSEACRKESRATYMYAGTQIHHIGRAKVVLTVAHVMPSSLPSPFSGIREVASSYSSSVKSQRLGELGRPGKTA
jgi:hypothetical protein